MLSSLEERVKLYAMHIWRTSGIVWKSTVEVGKECCYGNNTVWVPQFSYLFLLFMLVEWSYGLCTYKYCVTSASWKHVLKQERSHNSYEEHGKQYPLLLYCKTMLDFAITSVAQEMETGLRCMKIKINCREYLRLREEFLRNENVSCREILYLAFPHIILLWC